MIRKINQNLFFHFKLNQIDSRTSTGSHVQEFGYLAKIHASTQLSVVPVDIRAIFNRIITWFNLAELQKS